MYGVNISGCFRSQSHLYFVITSVFCSSLHLYIVSVSFLAEV